MSAVVVRYRIRDNDADANQQLIDAVFVELASTQPDGIAYAVYRLDNGTFVHIAHVTAGSNPLESMEAFGAFTRYLPDRCEPGDGPDPQGAALVGNYRLVR